ncbi:hypothetical protein FOA52_014395 [Chlamydomonas sp. UWO 241]|nr:hypothetical protein FOA52_014395 [Chlamydomonas sp. UWO 241]
MTVACGQAWSRPFMKGSAPRRASGLCCTASDDRVATTVTTSARLRRRHVVQDVGGGEWLVGERVPSSEACGASASLALAVPTTQRQQRLLVPCAPDALHKRQLSNSEASTSQHQPAGATGSSKRASSGEAAQHGANRKSTARPAVPFAPATAQPAHAAAASPVAPQVQVHIDGDDAEDGGRAQEAGKPPLSSSTRGLAAALDRLEALARHPSVAWVERETDDRDRPRMAGGEKLLHAIRSASTGLELVHLHRSHGRHMGADHVGAMMRGLARIAAARSGQQQQQQSSSVRGAGASTGSRPTPSSAHGGGTGSLLLPGSEAALWAKLCVVAQFTMPGACMRDTVNVVAALHAIGSARECAHAGWVRAAPPSAEPGGAATPGASHAAAAAAAVAQQARVHWYHAAASAASATAAAAAPATRQLRGTVSSGLPDLVDAWIEEPVDGAVGAVEQAAAATRPPRADAAAPRADAAALRAAAAAAAAPATRQPRGVLSSGLPDLVDAWIEEPVRRDAAQAHRQQAQQAQQTRPRKAQQQQQQRAAYGAPLHSSASLHRPERHLARAALAHSTRLLLAAASPPPPSPSSHPPPPSLTQQHQQQQLSTSELLSLLSVVGRLGFAPGPEWQAAFFTASAPMLEPSSSSTSGSVTKAQLLSLAAGVSRLQPARRPPPAWVAAFLAASSCHLPSLTPPELTALLVAVSRLPGVARQHQHHNAPPHPAQHWLRSVVSALLDSADELDAPGLALCVHALGRLRGHAGGSGDGGSGGGGDSERACAQELLERLTGLLDDFSPEELSLVLRGCAMLRVQPEGEWLEELYAVSGPRLRQASGPQLANIGWALASLQVLPPRQWLQDWEAQLRRRCQPPYGRPLGVQPDKWHGLGYDVHARRATAALASFGATQQEIERWCASMRTPVPRVRERPPPAADASSDGDCAGDAEGGSAL